MTSRVTDLDQARDRDQDLGPDRKTNEARDQDQDPGPDRKTNRAKDQDRAPTERVNKGRGEISTEAQTGTGFHGTVMAKDSR